MIVRGFFVDLSVRSGQKTIQRRNKGNTRAHRPLHDFLDFPAFQLVHTIWFSFSKVFNLVRLFSYFYEPMERRTWP
jgi:hypothetical protein